jgi:hypothetical protein
MGCPIAVGSSKVVKEPVIEPKQFIGIEYEATGIS